MRFALLLMCSGCCCTGVQLTVGTASVCPGGTASITVRLEPEDTPVAAVQFDLEHPDSGFGLTLAPSAELQETEKYVYAAGIAPKVTRFLIAGRNQWPMPGGVIVTIRFKVLDDTGAGTYPLKILDSLAVDAGGDAVPLSGADGSLTVENPVAASLAARRSIPKQWTPSSISSR